MSVFHADVTIVGSGIAGLWSAKELIDRGFTVNIVEKSDTLAHGATTKNEGWLHAGTYHSVAIEKEDELESVVTNTRLSHEEIIGFAPEAIDHEKTFAVTLSDELTQRAMKRWNQTGVGFREVSKDNLPDASVIDTTRLNAAFEVEDKSVNSRKLCQKLARYIYAHGGTFFLGATFIPENDSTAIIIQKGSKQTLRSEQFLITAGVGLKGIVESITGQELPMRYFKAHLLVVPRVTTHNYFHLEAGEAGFMNHGSTSVMGIHRDGIELPHIDDTVVPEKKELLYNALTRFLPSMSEHALESSSIMAVACSKPDVTGTFGETQSLDVSIFKPSAGYVCALPGKMTMAPYLAKRLADVILSPGASSPQMYRQDTLRAETTMRPADQWMSKVN